jgi:hypothetical protein
VILALRKRTTKPVLEPNPAKEESPRKFFVGSKNPFNNSTTYVGVGLTA